MGLGRRYPTAARGAGGRGAAAPPRAAKGRSAAWKGGGAPPRAPVTDTLPRPAPVVRALKHNQETRGAQVEANNVFVRVESGGAVTNDDDDGILARSPSPSRVLTFVGRPKAHSKADCHTPRGA